MHDKTNLWQTNIGQDKSWTGQKWDRTNVPLNEALMHTAVIIILSVAILKNFKFTVFAK